MSMNNHLKGWLTTRNNEIDDLNVATVVTGIHSTFIMELKSKEVKHNWTMTATSITTATSPCVNDP